ncbi:MAG: hypothetical protein GWM92_06420, partial [Gemmatimonadetes bacterium]|nr:hypothetical protein [Gemmatimonadota bacterium]NIR78251.1 hypothetical protein [Gemmatimonadota bacterium]NIT86831.1 hypothetical protein [Gemmatimonadota bacterium]NIU30701.1 hypothetical protein [Gemmatimonadota bacterium]NIU35500.1 hypothetical protein [Gemmatimonadota bacterium]
MTSPRACAFLTTDELDSFVVDDEEAIGPLRALGWTVDQVPWRRREDWDRFRIVVIRSAWDYQSDPHAFLEVLERIETSSARLENPLELVRWNLRKSYLRELEAGGVPVLPGLWEAGFSPDRVPAILEELGADEIVVKPVLGANADLTFRLSPDSPRKVLDAAERALGDRRILVQPFASRIVTEGEYSLFFFRGALSHGILKTPSPGDFRVQEEHGGTIRKATPDAGMVRSARRVFEVIESQPLYARVDLVRRKSG